MRSHDSSDPLQELSVITVVKDDPDGFSKTLQSLEEQTLPKLNWVVVDSSSDQTSIPALLSESRLPVDYVWVEPAGIYPAMNHGATLAVGKYIYFLNAGDTLIDSEILGRVADSVSEVSPIWAFGGVNFWDQNGSQLQEPAWNYHSERQHRFVRGRFPSHQGVIVRRDVFENLGGFDTSYAIAADYHMICLLSQMQDPLQLDFAIANFTQGGASTVSWRLAQTEFRRGRKSVFPLNFASHVEELYFGAKDHLSHLVASRRSKSQE